MSYWHVAHRTLGINHYIQDAIGLFFLSGQGKWVTWGHLPIMDSWLKEKNSICFISIMMFFRPPASTSFIIDLVFPTNLIHLRICESLNN